MLFSRFSCVSCRFILFNTTKYSYHKKMNDLYFRYVEPAERFDLTFSYEDKNYNVNRTFNLKRNISETLTDFSSRIKTNIDKVIASKVKRRKKNIDVYEEIESEITIDILKDNKPIEGSRTCKEVFFSGEDEISVKINEKTYKILINPPWVDHLSVPQSLMVGFYAYPCKFEILFGSKSQCTFIWYKSNPAGADWKEVSTESRLYLTEDFLGCKIKLVCIPGNGEVTGPEVSAESNAVIKTGPTDMPYLLRHQYTDKPLLPGSFRVVSYNLLADVYAETETAKTELFPYCPPYARNIDYRKQLFIKEMIGYHPDIICLQECDVRIFKNDLSQVLNDFEGVMTCKSGTVSEGIATFFAKNKFRLVEKKELMFSEEVDKNPLFSNVWEKIKSRKSVRNTFKERTTVFHALILECLNSGNVLVVGNTHLYFHPDADHIRLIQGGMAVLFMEDIINTLQKNGKKTTLIFCGDMNSTPDCGLYILMTQKKAPADLMDWRSDPNEVVEGLEFTQPFEMRSAYGTPPFTNFTEKFAGCLDYIYYQSDVLKLIQAVPLPEETVLRAHTALPSPVFPSDHISLVADFTWSL